MSYKESNYEGQLSQIGISNDSPCPDTAEEGKTCTATSTYQYSGKATYNYVKVSINAELIGGHFYISEGVYVDPFYRGDRAQPGYAKSRQS